MLLRAGLPLYKARGGGRWGPRNSERYWVKSDCAKKRRPMAAGGRPPLVCLAVLVLFSVNISAALTHHPSQCRENGRFDDDCCAERKAMACANGYKLRRSDMCCFKIVVCFAYKYQCVNETEESLAIAAIVFSLLCITAAAVAACCCCARRKICCFDDGAPRFAVCKTVCCVTNRQKDRPKCVLSGVWRVSACPKDLGN